MPTKLVHKLSGNLLKNQVAWILSLPINASCWRQISNAKQLWICDDPLVIICDPNKKRLLLCIIPLVQSFLCLLYLKFTQTYKNKCNYIVYLYQHIFFYNLHQHILSIRSSGEQASDRLNLWTSGSLTSFTSLTFLCKINTWNYKLSFLLYRLSNRDYLFAPISSNGDPQQNGSLHGRSPNHATPKALWVGTRFHHEI